MNQCQGCQAGWPLIETTCPLTGVVRKRHLVVGGYKGETASCTKHLYHNNTQTQRGDNS